MEQRTGMIFSVLVKLFAYVISWRLLTLAFGEVYA